MKAYPEALRLLSRRGYFEAELRIKLREKGCVEIDQAIERLKELGYLNDRESAVRFVEARFAKGEGPYTIAARLGMRWGDDAKEIVDSTITYEREKEKIQEYLARASDKRKEAARLARKGFRSELVAEGIVDF